MTASTKLAAPITNPRRFSLARVLAVLEVFLAGGFVAVLLVRQLLLDIMHRLVSGAAQGEILNVLDQLLPYTLGYMLALLVVGSLAALAWLQEFAGRSR